MNEWDPILAEHHPLTMASSASASGVMDELTISVYKDAADTYSHC